MENKYQPNINDEIKIDYHGELMENFFDASTLDASSGFRVVKYSGENTILFFIDDKTADYRQLKMVVQLSGQGWKEYTLSAEKLEVSAFDVQHSIERNKLRIAYAGTTEQKSNRLFVSNELDLSETGQAFFIELDQANSKFACPELSLSNPEQEIDHISLGEQGGLFSTSFGKADATYGYFKYGTQKASKYNIPENTSKILQLETGQIDGEFGVFLLYEMEGERTLLFISFPEEDLDPSSLRFNPTDTINSFYCLPNPNGNCDLFVAGDGIFRYKGDDLKFYGEYTPETIYPANGNGDRSFGKIVAANNKAETTVWCTGEKDENLYYLTNRYYDKEGKPSGTTDGKWTKPRVMHKGVDDFVAVKGDRLLNQLFLLKEAQHADGAEGGSSLIHFWQDKASTMWMEDTIEIAGMNEVKTKETFTINVNFQAKNRICTFHEAEVQVSAETNMYLYLNEELHLVGPRHPVPVKIEGDALRIIYPTKSIAAASIFVKAKWLNEPVQIDPTHKLTEKIENLFASENSLKGAKVKGKDGTERNLITNEFSDNDIKAVIDGTKAMVNAKKENTNKPQLRGVGGPIPVCSIQFDSSSTLQRGVGDWIDDIGGALGDVYHAVRNGLEELKEIVVEKVGEAWKVVIKIGGEVLEWVSEVASDIYRFCEIIWSKVKIFFKDLFEFMAFLFNWDDILRTKEVLKKYMNNVIDGLKKNIVGFKQDVNEIINNAQKNLDNYASQILKSELNKKKVNEMGQEHTGKAKDPRMLASIDNNKSHLAEAKSTKNSSEEHEDLNAKTNEIANKLNEINEAARNSKDDASFEQIVKDLEDIQNQLMQAIEGKIPIGTFIHYVFTKLASIVLEVAQAIVNLILDFFVLILESVQGLLNYEIEVPFFSTLYEKVSDSTLTFLDLTCLFIAIPTTVLYKIGTGGKVPFSNKPEEDAYLASAENMFTFPVSDKHPTANTLLRTPADTTAARMIYGYVGAAVTVLKGALYLPLKAFHHTEVFSSGFSPTPTGYKVLNYLLMGVGYLNLYWYHFKQHVLDNEKLNLNQFGRWIMIGSSFVLAIEIGAILYLVRSGLQESHPQTMYNFEYGATNIFLPVVSWISPIVKVLGLSYFDVPPTKPSFFVNTVNNALCLTDIAFLDQALIRPPEGSDLGISKAIYYSLHGSRAVLLALEGLVLGGEVTVENFIELD